MHIKAEPEDHAQFTISFNFTSRRLLIASVIKTSKAPTGGGLHIKAGPEDHVQSTIHNSSVRDFQEAFDRVKLDFVKI
ncbi:unnamed protein product [Ambrosiozyma monospora]|uniref:Unnamed protein product n=1 Tax=Ambrosiozyma monospora TaxID=43982 RepID=A0A9W6SWK7_AMBMO|nr:unnamed protein product [Ambrosiozyma monospora]